MDGEQEDEEEDGEDLEGREDAADDMSPQQQNGANNMEGDDFEEIDYKICGELGKPMFALIHC